MKVGLIIAASSLCVLAVRRNPGSFTDIEATEKSNLDDGVSGDRAFTVQGNGFWSVTAASGTIASVLNHRQSAHVGAILERFNILTSGSGGGWYMSLLAYSQAFEAYQEELGTSLNAATWTESIFDHQGCLASTTGVASECFGEILTAISGIDYSKPIYEHAPNAWAKGREWVLQAALATPPPEFAVFLSESSRIFYTTSARGINASQYRWLPVKFSVPVGGAASEDMPSPFCGDETCFGLEVTYGTSEDSDQVTFRDVGAHFKHAFSKVGRLALIDVVGASSMCCGPFIVNNKEKPFFTTDPSMAFFENTFGFNEFVTFDLNSSQQVSHPFASGRNLISSIKDVSASTASRALEQTPVLVLQDGAFVDNSAILAAVAAGAAEVTAILNADASALAMLFGCTPMIPYPVAESFGIPIFEPVPFQISKTPDPSNPQPTSGLNIFFPGKTRQFVKPPGLKVVRNISLYEIDAITRDEPASGIAGGRHVKVKAIALDTYGNWIVGNQTEFLSEIFKVMKLPANGASMSILSSYFS